IKKYLEVYWKNKKEMPNLTEKQVLERVADTHMNSKKRPKSMRSGKQYLNYVFCKDNICYISIFELIEHFILFEFPRKYKPLEYGNEDIFELERRIRSGEKSKKELLIEKIEKMSDEIKSKAL
ncbi:hypothetical protein HZA38_00910, partial [Candidatus Peregrinibacteria bacterium]|nr:hypothetical protein [Candidatus Peregrinibacteria bacterium]